MKKQSIFLIVCLFLAFVGCTEDSSRYVILEKEDIEVDELFGPEEGEQFDPAILIPGVHRITLNVEGATVPNRSFKYYFPISINPSKPISLVFQFHGNYTYEGDNVPDPLLNFTQTSPMCIVADTANIVVVYPAGLDEGGSIGWQGENYLSSISFVDEIVKYFKSMSPQIDPNRIYVCGHSSGAIFSYVLATERSEVFAAAVPVSGQRALNGTETTSRIVPIRAFNGEKDDAVNFTSALNNITNWADQLAYYYPSSMDVKDPIEVSASSAADGVYTLTPYVWNKGSADIEFWAIPEEGHNISWSTISHYMWDFMKGHTLDQPEGFYASVEYKTLVVGKGESATMGYRHSPGALISITGVPDGWSAEIKGDIIEVVSPSSISGGNAAEGEISFTATKSGETKEFTCLVQIKTWFDVGDIVYDDNDSPYGIVYWVDPSNNKRAKVLSIYRWTKIPIGVSLELTDLSDGAGNTAKIVTKALADGLNEDQCAPLKCHNYTVAGGGWYMPAYSELNDGMTTSFKAIVNDLLTSVGGDLFSNAERDVWTCTTTGTNYRCFDWMSSPYQYAPSSTVPVTRAVKVVTK